MTKQTLATTLLVLAMAVFFVAPAVQPADGPAKETAPPPETTSAPETSAPVSETTEPPVTTTAPAETEPAISQRMLFEEKVGTPDEALDFIQRHFFRSYSQKINHPDGGYHYAHEDDDSRILSVTNDSAPYRITMSVTINDEPLTSEIYYVTPDGENTFVDTAESFVPAETETSVSYEDFDFTFPVSVTIEREISSDEEALELVRQHFAFEYTQRHSYETIGTYYSKPDDPTARLEVDSSDGGVYIIHRYTDGSDKENYWYSVTSKDGKTIVAPRTEPVPA